MMSTITFREVVYRATFRWTEDGKKRQKTQAFSQTINPFNLNAAGAVKTADEIRAELKVQADAWLAHMTQATPKRNRLPAAGVTHET